MKKTLLLFSVLSLLLFGCSREPEVTVPTLPPVSVPETVPTEPLPAYSDYSAPLVTFSAPVAEQTFGPDALLTYTCQQMELLLEDPQVSEAVTLALMNHSDFSLSSGPDLLKDARESGQSFELTLLHTPARLDRGILSLVSSQVVSGDQLRATGTLESVTFDLITGRQLSLKDVLIPQYDAELLSDAIIGALEPLAKEGLLYSDYAYVIRELFFSNTPMDRWYLSETGLCVYFAPYEIAPYNLHYVTAEIPYDQLPGLLREVYFPGETLYLVGQLRYARDPQTHSQFRDLILDANGTQRFLTVEGAVEDLRIESGAFLDGQYVPGATVFASETLCRGDVIVLQATQETLDTLYAGYLCGGEYCFVPLSTLPSD